MHENAAPKVTVLYEHLSCDSKKRLDAALRAWADFHKQIGAYKMQLVASEAFESGQLEYAPGALYAGDSLVWKDKPDRPDASFESAGTSFNVHYEQTAEVPKYDRAHNTPLNMRKSASRGVGGNEATPSKLSSRLSNRCWNCGSYAHSLKECHHEHNQEAISQARQEHRAARGAMRPSRGKASQARYFNGDDAGDEYSGLVPGQLTPELREALGIAANDPPPWLGRMRSLGFPPGFRRREEPPSADVTTPHAEALCIFDGGSEDEAGPAPIAPTGPPQAGAMPVLDSSLAAAAPPGAPGAAAPWAGNDVSVLPAFLRDITSQASPSCSHTPGEGGQQGFALPVCCLDDPPEMPGVPEDTRPPSPPPLPPWPPDGPQAKAVDELGRTPTPANERLGDHGKAGLVERGVFLVQIPGINAPIPPGADTAKWAAALQNGGAPGGSTCDLKRAFSDGDAALQALKRRRSCPPPQPTLVRMQPAGSQVCPGTLLGHSSLGVYGSGQYGPGAPGPQPPAPHGHNDAGYALGPQPHSGSMQYGQHQGAYQPHAMQAAWPPAQATYPPSPHGFQATGPQLPGNYSLQPPGPPAYAMGPIYQIANSPHMAPQPVDFPAQMQPSASYAGPPGSWPLDWQS